MPILYRADTTTVTAVDCPRPHWPNVDADGKPISQATHYATAAEAWRCVLALAEARLGYTRLAVEELQRQLQVAEKDVRLREAELKAAKLGAGE